MPINKKFTRPRANNKWTRKYNIKINEFTHNLMSICTGFKKLFSKWVNERERVVVSAVDADVSDGTRKTQLRYGERKKIFLRTQM